MDAQPELHLQFDDDERPVEKYAVNSWRGISVEYSRLKLPIDYEFRWDGGCHYLAYHELILLDGEMTMEGDKPVAGGDLRGRMTFAPEGQAFCGWAKPADRMNEFTVLCVEPSAMPEELQAEFNPAVARSHIYFKDELLGATMKKLATMMADEQHTESKIYTETVGLTAALEMFKFAQQGSIAAKAISSGHLSRTRQHLVLNFIVENLSRDFGLEELASLCGLTRFHFARAFKATFHETPHQYVLGRRLEKAMDLLIKSRLPISEVACVVGFSGSSQFARSFKAATGKTPLEFRRSA